ncbi:MAG: ATP-dependent RecD-like DNA helicase [Victivallales bacterium]|jgi:exodeoxyribonuclease V alpha subunit|nr:ATP-dependent RecD-like DNA helicase [Victivallales bacterium]
MTNSPTKPHAKLSGEITRVIFESDDGAFAVIKIRESGGREYSVRGSLTGLVAGQELELEGVWEQHAEFGRQFKAEHFKIILLSTPDGITRYLSSGAIPGIGKKTAQLIVKHFGEKTLAMLDGGAKNLKTIPGIGAKKAEAIAKVWRESATRRDSYIFLQGLGITPAFCSKLFKRYGEAAPQMVKDNPYRLAEEVDGIGFLKADEIAKAIGIPRNSIPRLSAAAIYTLNSMIANGNVCCALEELCNATAELAEESPEQARLGIAAAIERRLLRIMDGQIYTPALARAETELPELVAKLALEPNFSGKHLRPVPGGKLSLNSEQQLAVNRVSQSALCIITGGPGVGKTTVVGEIVRRAKKAHLRIGLAAPTGRAAKRLGESTDLGAKTLHRLLQFDPTTNKFTYNAENPLPCDLLIVDEVSMLDILLAQALFRAIPIGCSVLLVGDKDQLPSVGPGTVLSSFIESGWFLVTELSQIFRQAENSQIIVNAHRVNHGLMPENPKLLKNELSDFYWIEQDDPEKVLSIIEKLVTDRIPNRFGFDPVNDIQILSPMNRGNCGTITINERVEELLNPGELAQIKFGDHIFKIGDKVMQIANNYDKNVFNGDMGKLVYINASGKKFEVMFDGMRPVEYALDEADQLTRSYAVTVHKSQGSEFPVVILPFLREHYMMLQRNLLYTAMTRARKLLIIVGSRRAVQMAVNNARLEPRSTLLTRRLQQKRQDFCK